jgi:N-acetylneuraminic acid mutarotase
MIVWGGAGGTLLNDGGQYDPVGDSWTATTTTGAPSGRAYHTAVWTGSRMIVWGGYNGVVLNDGGQWRTVSLYVKN